MCIPTVTSLLLAKQWKFGNIHVTLIINVTHLLQSHDGQYVPTYHHKFVVVILMRMANPQFYKQS